MYLLHQRSTFCVIETHARKEFKKVLCHLETIICKNMKIILMLTFAILRSAFLEQNAMIEE